MYSLIWTRSAKTEEISINKQKFDQILLQIDFDITYWNNLLSYGDI